MLKQVQHDGIIFIMSSSRSVSVRDITSFLTFWIGKKVAKTSQP